ncbi:MAG: T9SS type A sorting domain-containing protein [Ignavibacteria bacterium]|nr:T9SS type A sorting domain-containing protein [Ignavibacteria bacterium]
MQQNYPNPFNPSTIISYKLKRQGDVILRIHDIVGRQISELVNTRQNAGTYEATFSATNIPSGVYSYSLHVDGDLVASRRMAVVK